MDTDRKRQHHQPWCNPNQMQPQTHGVVTVGLAKAQRQEIALEERSLGWDQPGGAVPLWLLTLFSPKRGAQDTGRGSSWSWPHEAQSTLQGKSQHQHRDGHHAGGAHTPGTMKGRAHHAGAGDTHSLASGIYRTPDLESWPKPGEGSLPPSA